MVFKKIDPNEKIKKAIEEEPELEIYISEASNQYELIKKSQAPCQK